MATLTDNFDSYTDGALNGQGSWSGSTNFTIQGSVVQGGTKAVALSAGDSNPIVKDFTATTSGIQSVYGRTSNVASTGVWSFRLGINGASYFYMKNQSSAIYYFNGSTYVAVSGSISNDTWFQLECEFDASTDQARYRVNGGTWTGWANGTATFTDISRASLINDAGTAVNDYWDTLADTGTVASSIKTINGLLMMGVG